MKIVYTPREDIAKVLVPVIQSMKKDGYSESDAIDLFVTIGIETIRIPEKRTRRKKHG